MNVLDIFTTAAGVKPPRNIEIIRRERVRREGSPPYTWAFPVTAASATSAINLNQQFPESRKYAPLDYCQFTNNDTVDLFLLINGSAETHYVPAGSITTIRNVGISHIAARNLGAAATAAGKVYATFMREPLTDDRIARGDIR